MPTGTSVEDALRTEVRIEPYIAGHADDRFHRDLDLAPDRRMAVEQIDAYHGNPVRRAAILGAHANSLAGWGWFGLSTRMGFRAEVLA